MLLMLAYQAIGQPFALAGISTLPVQLAAKKTFVWK